MWKRIPHSCTEPPPTTTRQRNTSSMICNSHQVSLKLCLLTSAATQIQRLVFWAHVALETDLPHNDVDVCVVTETSLKLDMPAAVINIPN